MTLSVSEQALIATTLDELEKLTRHAQSENVPLEIEPQRGKLFALFVKAEAAGLVDEETGSLSADEICRQLAVRAGLTEAARLSTAQQAKLPPEHLARMRVLWSLMRMWMEWTYAWRRWSEFHTDASAPA
ncbi:hypothetical protein Pla110_01900 [Polystyrenella longa]|uniref:Uncharacterized protein n=1 Tax=Polystyrenella longa TaxID=2528007 RepID=A0A518CGX9_9PLAN|nr:hypothetical protein [Polystyrenella longa]QDU78486.1 hypothetical protein Pla110_01900 [Polystyrenella longa]